MNTATVQEFWKKGRLSFLIILASIISLLSLTWLKWGDLIIDLGREMYVPARIASGAVLYRDIFYVYGPFSPYWNALLYKIFGASVLTLVLSGTLVLLLTTFYLYKLCRIYLGVAFSTFAVLVFLFVCAFGRYIYPENYNYILPYSFSAIHAILFSLAGLFYFARYGKRRSVKDLYLSSFFILLCLLTRIEIGAMLVLAVATALGILKATQPKRSLELPPHFSLFLSVPLLLALAIYGIFWQVGGVAFQQSNFFDLIGGNIRMGSSFLAVISGGNNFTYNIVRVLNSFLGYLFLATCFFACGVLRLGWRSTGYHLGHWAACLGISLAGGAVAGWYLLNHFSLSLYFHCFPVMLILTGLVAIRRIHRADGRWENGSLFAVSIFSFIVVLRIIFRVLPFHYGFTFMVPGLIVYHVFLFKLLPDAAASMVLFFKGTPDQTSARSDEGEYVTRCAFFPRTTIQFGFVLFLIVVMFFHFKISQFSYRQATLPLKTPRGDLFLMENQQGKRCLELIDFLRNKVAQDKTVVVMPEGAAINFFSQRENPLYYYSFLPPDLITERVEDAIIADMDTKKVDYVVILQRQINEYGANVFGMDYGKKIGRYIRGKYTLAQQFGPYPYTRPNFGIAVFQRKP